MRKEVLQNLRCRAGVADKYVEAAKEILGGGGKEGKGKGSKGKGKGEKGGKASKKEILRRACEIDWELRLSNSSVLAELSKTDIKEWIDEVEALATTAGYKMKAEAEK